ncbi:integrase catalytic domain-containing protein [Trichonephila clavipes]|nr:integrase catalytic domain-containing protein [Trichonephila clavipes]
MRSSGDTVQERTTLLISFRVVHLPSITRAITLITCVVHVYKCVLLALRRFLTRRANCKVTYSDNARTFKAADRELAYFANILKDSEFQNFVADKEVEVIVHHRPLAYVENDPGESEPLTPAHFLELDYGDYKDAIHFIELIDAVTAKESYKKRKTYQTLLLKQLWRRCKEQYLLQLKTVNHFKTPSVHKNLKLNDVVLVEGNTKSKLLCEIGIIKEIFIGRDNNVRSCLVKSFKALFKKPIQLLYPLQIE